MKRTLAWVVAALSMAGLAVFGNEYRQAMNRLALFAEVQPVKVTNCELERFGDKNDGGYLLCGNLLKDEKSAYSYGINGTDNFGCAVAARLNVPVHQYDCFNIRRPPCGGPEMIFHEECVGPAPETRDDGSAFDTIASQIARNGDDGKRLLVKMDVEGAEWASLLDAPESLLNRIGQLVVEFHYADEARFIETVKKLKRTFYVAHLHYNNFACEPHHEPFPSWAFEVLFVNKNLAVADPSGARPTLPNQLDAPNSPTELDCQATSRSIVGSILRLNRLSRSE